MDILYQAGVCSGKAPIMNRTRGAVASPCRCLPKGSDLYMSGVKPGETPVEALSGSDVQIDRVTCV